MRGKITKIMDVRPARNRGLQTYARKFIRVTFKMDDGKWAKTDVCPEYRNYRTWRPIIRAGVDTVLVGLRYKERSTSMINADSPAKIDHDQSWNIGGDKAKCKQCTGSGMDQVGDHCKPCDGAGWLDPEDVAGEGDTQVSLFPDLKTENLNKGDYNG